MVTTMKNEMFETISQRKSVRKYNLEPLKEEAMENVRELIANVKPLYPDIAYSVAITDKTKGMFNIKAPHYLIFTSEEKKGAAENIGFVGQQLDLKLSAKGYGTCWLGGSKPQDKDSSPLPPMLCMAFGESVGSPHRTHSEFKRKPLAEISSGTDERLEAARLAPSGMNQQNWFFIAENNQIHCYRKKTKLGFTAKLAAIDIGIAICHLAMVSDEFSFSAQENVPQKKGFVYVGTVG
jgi:nitroreductase